MPIKKRPVRLLKDPHEFERYAAPSTTTKGVSYAVEMTERGEVVCSCPGYHHWQHCKHSDALKVKLEKLQKRMERL